uniref:RNI-like protein n=1 Tax=Strongyloides papillosus TaxID=174720 RepID=A0A0N5BNI1_STREA
MRCCSPNQLETLQFPHIGKPNNKNEESLLYKFLPYAKSVRFNESISRHDYSSQHFSDFFSGTKIFTEPNVSLTYQINIRFSDAEFGRYYERLARNNLLLDEQNNHENTNAGYMSITDLCLGNILFYDNTSKLTDEEAFAFTNDILRMKNLRSLQIRFFTFSTSNHFYYLCKGLNRNLENIKLEKCSGMSIGDVEEIARNCKYIKNLILEDITSETISLNKITSLFKHLVGLRLKFNSCYNAAKIINDIKRIDENGNFKIAWPPLQFLHIHCAYPKTNQRYILRKMAKNTPRRCGQFLFDYLKPSTYEKEYILRIIIQSNTSTCTKFKNSFAKTYLLG